MIWKLRPSVEVLNNYSGQHLGKHLGIEITEVGDDFLAGRMPVDGRTVQPYGILHGGASCVLAETLGSIGGSFCCDPQTEMVVGLEINANHIKSARNGFVLGVARPVHLGKTTQVWEIKITNEGGGLVCISRLTLAVRTK
ncbi:MAG: hotdog fold thioesterase [Chitinophagales bacterium]